MQIQPQNKTSFTASYPFNSPAHRTRIVNKLKDNGISHAVVGSEVITGKKFAAHVKKYVAKTKKALEKAKKEVVNPEIKMAEPNQEVEKYKQSLSLGKKQALSLSQWENKLLQDKAIFIKRSRSPKKVHTPIAQPNTELAVYENNLIKEIAAFQKTNRKPFVLPPLQIR